MCKFIGVMLDSIALFDSLLILVGVYLYDKLYFNSEKKKTNSFSRVLFKNFLSINLKTGYKNRFENRAVPAGER